MTWSLVAVCNGQRVLRSRLHRDLRRRLPVNAEGQESIGSIAASWGDGYSSWTVTGYASWFAPAGTRLVALAQCIRSIS